MLSMFSNEPITYRSVRPIFAQLDELLRRSPADFARTNDDETIEMTPRYEIDETPTHYVLAMETPGVSRSDLNIEVQGNHLKVTGERKRVGQSTRKFSGVFMLPQGTSPESIAADYTDGVLRIAIEKHAAAKSVTVKIGDGKDGGVWKRLTSGEEKN